MAKVPTPREGGSYSRDDDTGALTPIFVPQDAPPAAYEEPAAPDRDAIAADTPATGGSWASAETTGELTALFVPETGMLVPDDLPPPDDEPAPDEEAKSDDGAKSDDVAPPDKEAPADADDQTKADDAARAPDGPVDMPADLVGRFKQTPETPATADQDVADTKEHI